MLIRYEATATVTAWRKHKCRHCGQKFAYQTTRSARGVAVDWLGSSGNNPKRDARDRAKALAEIKLMTDFDCVPCPGCGRFQDEMIARLRRRKTLWWLVLSAPCWLLAPLALLVAALSTWAAVTAPKAPPQTLTVALVAWAVTGLSGFAAVTLATMWWLLRSRFDPYHGLSLAVWRKRAEGLGAVTAEQLERILAKQKAKEEAEIVKVELDPLTGQIDHTQKANPFEDAPEKPRKTERGTSGRPVAKPAPQVVVHPVLPPPPPEKNPFDFG